MIPELAKFKFLPVTSMAPLTVDEKFACAFILARFPTGLIGDVEFEVEEVLHILLAFPAGRPCVRRYIARFRP